MVVIIILILATVIAVALCKTIFSNMIVSLSTYIVWMFIIWIVSISILTALAGKIGLM